ncbi:hypothetical protein NQZ68_022233, partial [Dissostichus eleginoides]
MAEVMDLRGEQVTLGLFNFKIGLPKLLEHAIQAGRMFLKSLAKHNNIIKVNQTSSPLQVCEDQVHQPLESTGCITKTKIKDIELKQPLACDESSFVAIFRIYFHLPIATHQIQGGKPTSMTKTIQGIVNSRKGALFNFTNHSGYQYVTVSREGGGGFQHPFLIIPPPALDLTPNYGLAAWGNNGIRLHDSQNHPFDDQGPQWMKQGGADIWPSVHAPSSFPVDKDSHAVCDDYSHTPNILSFAQHLAWVQEHVFYLGRSRPPAPDTRTSILRWLSSSSAGLSAANDTLPPKRKSFSKDVGPLVSKAVKRSEGSDAVVHLSGVKIFYGSQTGTAKGFAKELSRDVKTLGIPAEVIDIKHYDPDDQLSDECTNMSVCVFLVATYTDGTPTVNAEWFCKWLEEASTDFRYGKTYLKGLRYAVFGLGNSVYVGHYNTVGKNVDKWLWMLSGMRILTRGEGDCNVVKSRHGSIQADFLAWKVKFLTRLQALAKGEKKSCSGNSKNGSSCKNKKKEQEEDEAAPVPQDNSSEEDLMESSSDEEESGLQDEKTSGSVVDMEDLGNIMNSVKRAKARSKGLRKSEDAHLTD